MRPGEHEEINLTIIVNNRTAAKLNAADAHLETTLVLHTARGKDSFLVVTGDYGAQPGLLAQ